MGLAQIKAFISYTVRSFIRDKSDVFWVVIWPMLLLFLTAFVFMPSSTGKPVTIKVGVVNYDNSSTPFNGTWLIELMRKVKFNGTKLFDVIIYNSEEKMLNDLKKAKIGVGLVIPNGFGANLTVGTSSLKVYVSGSSKFSIQINRQAIESFLSNLSKRVSEYKMRYALAYIGNEEFAKFLKGLVEPINVTIKEEAPLMLRLRPRILGWYVWSAIGMSFLYTGLILGATAIISEKEKGMLERILAAPISEMDMLFGKMLGGLCILFISALAVILAGIAIGAQISWNPLNAAHWIAVFSLVLVGVVTVSMGYLLSLVSKSSRAATNLGVTLGLLLTFTAGIWIPKEWLPDYFKFLAEIFPPTWGIEIIRKVLVLNRGLEVLPEFGKLVMATAVIFVLGVVAYRKTLRRYVEL